MPFPIGEMARLVREKDWSRTALGPIDQWPLRLRATVEMMLSHPMPMVLVWGPDLVQIYNDAYAKMAGKKHPAALGQPTRECWPEVWHINRPIYERVLRGESVEVQDRLFPIDRQGSVEDAWFTLQLGPLRDDDGEIGGFLLTATETTARVLAERDRERRQAEQTVQEAESLHRLAAEAGRTGSWYVLLETRKCVLSPIMSRLMGWPADRRGASMEEWRDRVHPEDRAALETAIDAAARSDKPFDYEFRIVLDDGSERWLYSHGAVVRDSASGRPLQLHGASVDITERKRGEEQLRRSHDTFYNLIQNNPFGVYVVDANFRLVQVSRGAQKVFENVRPLLGRDFAEVLRIIWPEPFASEAIARFRHTLATGEPYNAPSTVEQRADIGAIEAYDWRIDRVVLPDGRFGVVCYFYDMSERQRWEAALRESEERLRAAFQQTQAGIAQVDLAGRFVLVNDRYCQIVGRPREELLGMRMQDVTHPDDLRLNLPLFQRAAEEGVPFVIEKRYVRPEGSEVWVSNSVSAMRDRDGRPSGIIAASVDTTDRRRAEEALVRAKEEAERANTAKSEFLATLSHELRTPLTPVLLTVSLMESHPGLPEELREDVATIRRNVELESRLISDLLDLTRIERGKLHLDVRPVDLHLVVRAAIDICQREASAKLSVRLNAQRHIVRGDGTRLQQIFWNLVNNAMKFTGPEGTITVRSTDAGDGGVRVEVIDTGAGIDPAVLPKLFTAFEQGEARAERRQAGLGLGLAISRRLAEMHGGTITASSAGRGKGATFAVALPALEPSILAPSVTPPPRRRFPVLEGTRSLHVLLVEDHEPTLRVLERLLRQIGHRVAGVTSVASALALAAQDGFDLIISDLGLPDGSGLDVMRQLRDQYAGRAIALTGYGMESDVTASYEVGFAEHLTKPVDLAALEAAIARVKPE